MFLGNRSWKLWKAQPMAHLHKRWGVPFFFREQELEALESPAHGASIGELHHIPDKWRKHSDHNPSDKCNNSEKKESESCALEFCGNPKIIFVRELLFVGRRVTSARVGQASHGV